MGTPVQDTRHNVWCIYSSLPSIRTAGYWYWYQLATLSLSCAFEWIDWSHDPAFKKTLTIVSIQWSRLNDFQFHDIRICVAWHRAGNWCLLRFTNTAQWMGRCSLCSGTLLDWSHSWRADTPGARCAPLRHGATFAVYGFLDLACGGSRFVSLLSTGNQPIRTLPNRDASI